MDRVARDEYNKRMRQFATHTRPRRRVHKDRPTIMLMCDMCGKTYEKWCIKDEHLCRECDERLERVLRVSKEEMHAVAVEYFNTAVCINF